MTTENLNVHIQRIYDQGIEGTPGFLYVNDSNGKNLLKLPCLERPWRSNRKSDSCIPSSDEIKGDYKIHARHAGQYYARSKKRWNCQHGFIVKETLPKRDLILLHWGNTIKDSAGCILLGKKHMIVNGGHFITSSKKAYLEFYDVTEQHMLDHGYMNLTIKNFEEEGEEDFKHGMDRSDI